MQRSVGWFGAVVGVFVLGSTVVYGSKVPPVTVGLGAASLLMGLANLWQAERHGGRL